MSFQHLDRLISWLESDLGYIPRGDNSFDKWESIFNRIDEVQDTFKTVRYPTKQQKDVAWAKFAGLRDTAYAGRRQHFSDRSRIHLSDMKSRLTNAEYSDLDNLARGLISAGFLQIDDAEMKEKAKYLKETIEIFLSVKREITKEDAEAFWERVREVRESHDYYWKRKREYKEERRVNAREKTRTNLERNREKRDKAEVALEKQKKNLLKNEASLEKANDALGKMKDAKANLEDKIDESYNDNWKDKAEGWLSELEAKISDVESSIERLEKWIEEGEEKIKDIEGYIDRLKGWIDEDERKL